MIEKEKVLSDAPKVLNSNNNPWEVAIEGDSIIGTWKWTDARFFTEGGISDEDKEFTFTVTLKDNGKWKEVDSTSSKTSSIRMHNGKLSFSKDISFSKGKTYQKSISFGIGQDKKSGKVRIVESKLDTSIIKKSVRDYLKQCGWKKAGLFG